MATATHDFQGQLWNTHAKMGVRAKGGALCWSDDQELIVPQHLETTMHLLEKQNSKELYLVASGGFEKLFLMCNNIEFIYSQFLNHVPAL